MNGMPNSGAQKVENRGVNLLLEGNWSQKSNA